MFPDFLCPDILFLFDVVVATGYTTSCSTVCLLQIQNKVRTGFLITL